MRQQPNNEEVGEFKCHIELKGGASKGKTRRRRVECVESPSGSAAVACGGGALAWHARRCLEREGRGRRAAGDIDAWSPEALKKDSDRRQLPQRPGRRARRALCGICSVLLLGTRCGGETARAVNAMQ
jgi:hypothetical protein